jgi:NAD-dependent SIR2 family protein deacetylase
MKKNIVFFLGAGFSCEADMPTMREFANYSDTEFMNITKHAFSRGNSFRLSAPLFYESGLYYRAFRRECEKKKRNRVYAKNIEWLFKQIESKKSDTIFRLLVEVIDHEGYAPINISKEELITHIKFWTWKIYNRLPLLNNNKFQRPYNAQLYSEFCSLIQNLYTDDNNLSIITTNYDLILEYCLWRNSANSENNGLVLPKACYPLKYEKINLQGNNDDFFSSEKNGIPVYKLHGSVNYYMRRNCEDILYISCDRAVHNVALTQLIGQPVAIHLDGLIGIRNEHGSDLIPEIIPPLPKKDYINSKKQWLKKTMKDVCKVLNEAEKIVFIGYSFPPTDKELAKIIKENINNYAEIILIDPNKKVRERYKKILDRKIEYLCSNLSSAIKNPSSDPEYQYLQDFLRN